MQVMINEKEALALLDTGSKQTLKKVSIVFVIGDENNYPMAEVYLEINGQIYQLTLGAVDKLSHPVLIGQDVLVLPKCIPSSRMVNMVITRSQKAAEIPEKDLFRSYLSLESVSRVRMRKSHQQRRQNRLEGTVKKV